MVVSPASRERHEGHYAEMNAMLKTLHFARQGSAGWPHVNPRVTPG